MKTALIIPSVYEYNLIEKDILESFDYVRLAGMGKVNSIIATSELIYLNGVDHVLLFGFAGGIRNLSLGQIIEPSLFIEGDYEDPVRHEVNELRLQPSKLLHYSTDSAIITQDHFLTSNPYTFAYPTLATDMESYALARLCQVTHTTFNCVKIISDLVGEESLSFDRITKKFGAALNLTLNEISDHLCELK